MLDVQPNLALLFMQLGLAADDQAIEQFIHEHQLPASTKLNEASFWTDAQRQFLQTHLTRDDDWALVIDELNQQLHVDSDQNSSNAKNA